MKIKATKGKDAMRYKLQNRRILVQKIEDNQYIIRLVRMLPKDFNNLEDFDSLRSNQDIKKYRNRYVLTTSFRLTEEALECLTHAYKELNK
jgi:hypothetical protein